MAETFVLTNEPVVKYLKQIIKLIEENRFEEIEKQMTFFSTEGDGFGMENTCIDFSRVMGDDYKDGPVDFGDVLRMLKDKQKAEARSYKELEQEIEKTRSL